jgi:hypothetical protein
MNRDQSRNKKPNKHNSHESDTQRIIHRHLKNKDDIITDEDIRNVQVGANPPQLDDATLARFEDVESTNNESDKKPLSPWDIVESEE